MKKIGYVFFALLFNIYRCFPLQSHKVVLFNGHNHGLNGNLKEIKDEMQKETKKYRFVLLAKRDQAGNGMAGKILGILRFFFVFPYHMATAGTIFMNDNFLPLGYCIPSKKAKIVQLWHGAGAFKKFGLTIEENENVRQQVAKANTRVTHLFVTSEQVVPIYEEAFAIPRDRIYATGIPVMDVYYRSEMKKQRIQNFYKTYPNLKGKKILLYTPTFRRTQKENQAIMEHFPVEELHQELGEDWVILVKMHPKYPVDNILQSDYCLDMTQYPQIIDLFFVSDMLVTDYSSTVVEYALLHKPIVMYAYDLDAYDRGFYFDYEKNVPGPVVKDTGSLLKAVKNVVQDDTRHSAFVKLEFDLQGENDSCYTRRVLDCLAAENKNNKRRISK